MNAALLRRLFASAQTGSNPDLKAVCRAIIEDEKRLGHSKLATELESAYTKIEPTSSSTAGRPRPPRTNSLSATQFYLHPIAEERCE